MEQALELLKKWGYWAILLGAMIEGESVILPASAFAAQGYFSITKVMIVAFLGTLFADQGLFFLGRHYGDGVLKRFPRLQGPADRAFSLLQRWDTAYILIFRFIYGIRIISPFVIGAAHVGVHRFMILNFIAAVIWTFISCGAGYLMGEAIMGWIEAFDVYPLYGLLVMAAIVVAWMLLHKKLTGGKKVPIPSSGGKDG